MNKRNSNLFLIIVLLIPVDFASAADALEEVTVTAQRRTQDYQDVPISVTAFSAEEIEKLNIQSAEDYLALTPNVNFAQDDGERGGNNIRVSIRGVSYLGPRESPGVGNERVGYYLDDLSVVSKSAGAANIPLYDMESIEVLRGPQGTLFGRNATGGALNIKTNKPNDEYSAKLNAGYGRFDTYEVSGVINIPLADNFFLRAVGAHGDSDGTVENTFSGTPGAGPWLDFGSEVADDNGVGFYFGRLSARWLATENMTIDTTISYSEESQGTDGLILAGCTGGFGGGLAAIAGCTPASPTANPTQLIDGLAQFPSNRDSLNHGLRGEFIDNESFSINSRISYDFGNTILKLIGGYTENDYEAFIDIDRISSSNFARFNDQTTKGKYFELRLHSDYDESPWTWVAGVNYTDNERIVNEEFILVEIPFGPFAAGDLPNNSFGTTFFAENIGLFGDFTYEFDERLSFSGGLRLSHENVGEDQPMVGSGGNTITNPTGGTFFARNALENETTDLSGRAALNYNLTDDLSVYTSFSSAFQAGGVSINSSGGVATQFDEEKVYNYEIGFKGEFLENRLRLEAAVFYMQWDDLQVSNQVIPNGNPVLAFDATDNVTDGAESIGFELSTVGLVTDNLQLGGSLGFLDAHFNSFTNAIDTNGNAFDASGHEIPGAPKWTVNVFGEYSQPVYAGDAFVRLEWSYRSDYYSDFGSLSRDSITQALNSGFPNQIEAYDVGNLRAGWSNEKFSINAYVENLLDENYYTGSLLTFGAGTAEFIPHHRNFGVTASINFD